ncbi:sensor domain-containing diguanylate cyclase [Marinobacterium lutimaris]|uniref:diguanylate cyclase n=1 Tax=Marinobacterium lutimaris TaxID=568106 RepID=A0A1H5X1K7_9GAMM|nr:sensor domain-containing diguanylate cyclase [Marinobacterium lutimaris]SEG05724.1 diguanylate cyclase [Marinobacterium lutimaris]
MPLQRARFEWITLLASLTLLGVYIVWSIIERHTSTIRQEEQRLTAQAEIVNSYLSEHLDSIYRVLELVRRNLPEWQGSDAAMDQANTEFQHHIETLNGIRTLAVLDKQGDVIASSRASLLQKNFSQREYYQTALTNPAAETLHISRPFLAVTDHWVMTFSLRIENQNGDFDGVVLASIDPERFRTTLNAVNYAPDMWSALAHGSGIQLLMEPFREGQQGMNLAQPGSFFSRHLESGLETNLLRGTVYATGEERVMALRTIRPPNLHLDEPIILAVGRDLDEVFADWRDFGFSRALIFTLLCFSSCFLMFRLQSAQRARFKSEIAASALIKEKNAQLEQLNAELTQQALSDALTGIANRRSFDEVFLNEWQRCQREGNELTLMLIDIDYFKPFNDHYGHLQGDECIRRVATQLKQSLARGSDFVARYGGEEFACLVPKCGFETAGKLAEKLRQGVEQLAIEHGHSQVSTCVTISVGYAVCIPDNSAPTALIAKADECLYYAKAGGRNQVMGFDRASVTETALAPEQEQPAQ